MFNLVRNKGKDIIRYLQIRKFTTFKPFQKIEKEKDVLTRYSKLSIFEYFGLTEERRTAKKEEILINELFKYINSNYLEREFKYLINDKEAKFKFFIFHVSLLIFRLNQILVQKKKELNDLVKTKGLFNLVFYNTLLEYILIKKITFLYRNLQLKHWNNETFINFLKSDQINSSFNFIIETQFVKRFSKIEYSMLKFKKQLVNVFKELQLDDNCEALKIFKEKFLKKVLLKNTSVTEQDLEKLCLYFIAHRNYLESLSFEDINKSKIFWGLEEIKQIERNDQNDMI